MWFCNGKKTSKDTKYSQGKQTDWVTTSLTIIFLEKAFTRSFEFLVWSCFLFLWLFTTAWNSRFWILIDKSFDSGKISPQVVVQKMGETTRFNPKQSKIWNYCLIVVWDSALSQKCIAKGKPTGCPSKIETNLCSKANQHIYPTTANFYEPLNTATKLSWSPSIYVFADETSMKVFCICIASHCRYVLYNMYSVHIQYKSTPWLKGGLLVAFHILQPDFYGKYEKRICHILCKHLCLWSLKVHRHIPH